MGFEPMPLFGTSSHYFKVRALSHSATLPELARAGQSVYFVVSDVAEAEGLEPPLVWDRDRRLEVRQPYHSATPPRHNRWLSQGLNLGTRACFFLISETSAQTR